MGVLFVPASPLTLRSDTSTPKSSSELFLMVCSLIRYLLRISLENTLVLHFFFLLRKSFWFVVGLLTHSFRALIKFCLPLWAEVCFDSRSMWKTQPCKKNTWLVSIPATTFRPWLWPWTAASVRVWCWRIVITCRGLGLANVAELDVGGRGLQGGVKGQVL